MTMEPPQGLRSNLLWTYQAYDDKELNEVGKPDVYKKLLFAFAFFHAIIQDRRKFGPIGWNIRYEFTAEDLDVCRRQLKIFLDEYDHVPYKVLNFLGADINYGGRVTDDKDKILISSIMRTYIWAEAVDVENYKLSKSGIYTIPPSGD